jgi:PEP-CTERM motif
MNLLKSVQTSLLGKSKWALLSGALLWLSVGITPVAQAASINYEINNGLLFSGSFSWDSAPLLTPSFSTNWNFDPTFVYPNITFATHSVLGFNNNNTSGLGFLSYSTDNTLTKYFEFRILPGNTYSLRLVDSVGNIDAIQKGSYSVVPSVPEPSVVVLLAIGMLALAGSRWLPSRREN